MKTFIATLLTAAVAVTTVEAKNFSRSTNLKWYSSHSSSKWHTVRKMTIPKNAKVSSFTDKITWKDQGWGNRKGGARIVVNRGNKVVSNVRVFGTAHHGTTRRSYTAPKSVLHKMKAGDTVKLEFHVGGGGGHKLRVFNDHVKIHGHYKKKHVHVKKVSACHKHKKVSKKSDMGMGFLSSTRNWACYRERQAAFRAAHMRLSKHRHHMIHRYFAHKHRMNASRREVHIWSRHHHKAQMHMIAMGKRAGVSAHRRNHYHKLMMAARGNYHAWVKIVRGSLHRYMHAIKHAKGRLHKYRHASGLAMSWTHRYRHAIKVVAHRNKAMHAAMHRFRSAIKHRNNCNKHRVMWLSRRGAYLKAYKIAVHLQKHHRGKYHVAVRHRKLMLHKYRHATHMWKKWSHIARVHHHAAVKATRHHKHVRAVFHHKIAHHRRAVHAHNHWRAKAIKAHIAVRKHAMTNMHLW